MDKSLEDYYDITPHHRPEEIEHFKSTLPQKQRRRYKPPRTLRERIFAGLAPE